VRDHSEQGADRKSSAGKNRTVSPATTYKPYSSRPYNELPQLVTAGSTELLLYWYMFSMKMRWVRFADNSTAVLEEMNARSVVPRSIGGHAVLLVNHQDQLFLVKNKCPHQGASLSKAHCEDGMIVCPRHRYGFDLKTGRGAGLYLDTYPIEEREDGVYAGFEYFSWFGE